MTDPRLQRAAAHLHALGPRAVAEFLEEIGRAHGIGDDLVRRLDAWQRLDPATLRAVLDAFAGGRQFAPHLHLVRVA